MMSIRQQIEERYLNQNESLYNISRSLRIPFRSLRQIVQDERWVWRRSLASFVRDQSNADVVLLDLETTGLPRSTGRFNEYWHYTDNTAYDSSRILQIAYTRMALGTPVARESIYSFYRKPDDFDISPESFAIHHITPDLIENFGQPLTEILPQLLVDLRGCTFILAHNANFDLNILKNEMFRLGYATSEIDSIFPEKKVKCTCTMTDFTKLGTLYSWIPNAQPLVLHNAQDDVLALGEILHYLSK